jgi:hypothetical protein
MRGGVVFGPETEDFEAGAGLGMVDDIEGFAFGVVFDAEGVEVCSAGWEVEELEGFGDGACGRVVVEVELALVLRVPVDALPNMLVDCTESAATPRSPKTALEITRCVESRDATITHKVLVL